MYKNTDLYISNSAMTANELHETIVELCDVFNIDDFNKDVESIIRMYTNEDSNSVYTPDGINTNDPRMGISLSDIDIETKSYDIKSIIVEMGVKNDMDSMSEWDWYWNQTFDKHKYHDFIKAAILHRNTFQSVRASYLMHVVGRKALEAPPKNFGVLQLVCEKYIQDVLQFDGSPAEYFTVKYEDFDGEIQSIQARATKKLTIDNIDDKPQSYWVGKTLFDSFFMMPLLDNETSKWKMIPVDLIRSIKEGFSHVRWENPGGRDDI